VGLAEPSSLAAHPATTLLGKAERGRFPSEPCSFSCCRGYRLMPWMQVGSEHFGQVSVCPVHALVIFLCNSEVLHRTTSSFH
jgi:hypothetical protein